MDLAQAFKASLDRVSVVYLTRSVPRSSTTKKLTEATQSPRISKPQKGLVSSATVFHHQKFDCGNSVPTDPKASNKVSVVY